MKMDQELHRFLRNRTGDEIETICGLMADLTQDPGADHTPGELARLGALLTEVGGRLTDAGPGAGLPAQADRGQGRVFHAPRTGRAAPGQHRVPEGKIPGRQLPRDVDKDHNQRGSVGRPPLQHEIQGKRKVTGVTSRQVFSGVISAMSV